MLSDDYQTIMAEAGLTPGQGRRCARCSVTTSTPQATVAAASNAKLTPAAPGWANVEGSRVLEDLFGAIAQGGDVAGARGQGRRADERTAQRLTRHRYARPRRGRRESAAPAAACPRTPDNHVAARPGAPSPGARDRDADRAAPTPRRPRVAAPAQLLPYALLLPAVLALALALGYPLVRQVVLSFQEFGLAQQFGRPPSGSACRTTASSSPTATSGGSPSARSPSAWSTRRSPWSSASALALLMRHMSKPRTPARADRAAARLGDAGGRARSPCGSGSSTPSTAS